MKKMILKRFWLLFSVFLLYQWLNPEPFPWAIYIPNTPPPSSYFETLSTSLSCPGWVGMCSPFASASQNGMPKAWLREMFYCPFFFLPCLSGKHGNVGAWFPFKFSFLFALAITRFYRHITFIPNSYRSAGFEVTPPHQCFLIHQSSNSHILPSTVRLTTDLVLVLVPGVWSLLCGSDFGALCCASLLASFSPLTAAHPFHSCFFMQK